MTELRDQEEANLVKQDKLVRTKNERVPRLSDLTMRPVFAGRKTQGNLEAGPFPLEKSNHGWEKEAARYPVFH